MAKPEVDLDAALAAAKIEEPVKAKHPILSDAEVQAARDKARSIVEKERKDAAIKALVAEETTRLQREEGLVSGDPVKDELVNITMDLPEYSASVNINMEPYWHGHSYKVPRHVANTLREIMSRAWNHQHEIDGKTLAQSKQLARDTVISPVAGTYNAPQAMA